MLSGFLYLLYSSLKSSHFNTSTLYTVEILISFQRGLNWLQSQGMRSGIKLCFHNKKWRQLKDKLKYDRDK